MISDLWVSYKDISGPTDGIDFTDELDAYYKRKGADSGSAYRLAVKFSSHFLTRGYTPVLSNIETFTICIVGLYHTTVSSSWEMPK